MKLVHPECEHCKSRAGSLFKYCNLETLEGLSDTKSCTLYKTGQAIFHETSLPVGLYCLNSGKVKLHKLGSDGKEQITRLVKPGDIIGYRALMSDTAYSATATALEDAVICNIPKDSFFKVLRENEKVSDGLMKILCQNLEDSEKKLTEMAYKPVRERLAEALILIKTTYEEKNSEENFSISMTREDLASLVGTAKETVIRLLSDFKKSGIVKTEGRKITLLDPPKLVGISRMYD